MAGLVHIVNQTERRRYVLRRCARYAMSASSMTVLPRIVMYFRPKGELHNGRLPASSTPRRRPARAGRSAASGISTGVTSRGTPGRTRPAGQPVCAQVARRVVNPPASPPASAAERRDRRAKTNPPTRTHARRGAGASPYFSSDFFLVETRTPQAKESRIP